MSICLLREWAVKRISRQKRVLHFPSQGDNPPTSLSPIWSQKTISSTSSFLLCGIIVSPAQGQSQSLCSFWWPISEAVLRKTLQVTVVCNDLSHVSQAPDSTTILNRRGRFNGIWLPHVQHPTPFHIKIHQFIKKTQNKTLISPCSYPLSSGTLW